MRKAVIISVLGITLLIGVMLLGTEMEDVMADEEKKIVYLTFDDGPSEVTDDILDVLKREEVRATFFLIGEQITGDKEELLQEMVSMGHVLGVHTYSHDAGIIYQSAQSYLDDIKKTEERIKDVCGIQPTCFRFPWGSANCYVQSYRKEIIAEMEKKGYDYYDWNVSAEDSVGEPTIYSIYHNIEKDFKKYNEITILMHDSSVNKLTAQALPDIIRLLKENGYEFATVEQADSPCHFYQQQD